MVFIFFFKVIPFNVFNIPTIHVVCYVPLL